MIVTGYPKSGNTWFSLMLAYCVNAPYDNLHEPGVHPREEWQRKLTKGGLAHRSFADEIQGGVNFSHDLACLDQLKPGEKSVYIVRDGRDVVVSYFFYLNKYVPSDQQGTWGKNKPGLLRRLFGRATPMNRFVRNRAKEWAANVSEALAHPLDAIVHYEQLNTDTAGALRKLFDDLQLPVEDAVIANAVEEFRFERMSGRKKGEEKGDSFFRKGVIGDWREKFGDGEKAAFKAVAGEQLIRLGYEKDNNW